MTLEQAERNDMQAEADRLFNELLGQEIRKFRVAARGSQSDLASLTGISRASICNIELGRQNINVRQLVRLSVALGPSFSQRVHLLMNPTGQSTLEECVNQRTNQRIAAKQDRLRRELDELEELKVSEEHTGQHS